jgi:MoaA/NifB/PqqE/SkfB family radical SAM enzyme/SAM-dependent methyltransferase
MAAPDDAMILCTGGPSNARDPGCGGRGAPARALQDLEQDLRAAQSAGARTLIVAGGEPTIRPDLGRLLALIRGAGLLPGLISNGRMLVYPKLRKLLIAAGVPYLRVGLHGASAGVHDALVAVKGAFQQTLEGTRALLAEAPATMLVELACSVTADNVEELDALVDRVNELPCSASIGIRFVMPEAVEPEEWAPAERAAAAVRSALERARRAGARSLLAWEGWPACLLEPVAAMRDERLRCAAEVLGDREGCTGLPLELPGSRRHPLRCQECMHEATCPGASQTFLQHEGEQALRPTRSVRANSFNYELVRELASFTPGAGGCPARSLELEGGPARSVVLLEDARAGLYRSPTSDFSDAEIARVKDELEQVYIDVSERAALDDFTSSVRRARFHPECHGCGDRGACCRAMVVDPDLPFAREERWLKKEVSRARGRVLDVGCGEQPYRDELRRLLADGRIEYHGIDPDAAALERFRAAEVGGTLHHTAIEELDFEPGYFDYVFAFRSFNHFRDLQRAARVIARLMRVHGQLVLCDSPVFALLRRPEQVRWADRHAPVGHEHYRNWTSHQVVELLRAFPFRVDTHRPVTSESSNQWILKLMRVADAPGRSAPRPTDDARAE